MNDQARFKRARGGLVIVGVVWLALVCAAVGVLVIGVRSIMRGDAWSILAALLGAAAVYGLWEWSAGFAAKLTTNNGEGYRPWHWGMIARTEFGSSAQEFDIPLSYWQARDNFAGHRDVSGRAVSPNDHVSP